MTTVVRAPLPIRCLRLDAAILTPTGKQVLAVMATFARADGTSCYPSVERISRETGLGERTVERALAHLRRLGAIVPLTSVLDARRNHHAREYRITIDHLPATPRATATMAEGLPPQAAGGYRLDGAPSVQGEIVSEGGGRKAPTPPTPVSSNGSGRRDRIRILSARLGYSTRPDAVEELEAWLLGEGFKSMERVAEFMGYAANQTAPTGGGLFLRHVRGLLPGWLEVPAVVAP